jgi:hypothetical protein
LGFCAKCSKPLNKTGVGIKSGSFFTGALVGGKVGGGIGLAMGPLGAISGMVPGAVVGGLAALFGASKVEYCPNCLSPRLSRDNSQFQKISQLHDHVEHLDNRVKKHSDSLLIISITVGLVLFFILVKVILK